MVEIYKRREDIQERVSEHYSKAKSEDRELFAVFLKGSQNYMEDIYVKDSDVDTIALYLPNLKDLVLNRDLTKPELVLSNNEHIDRVDIRRFISGLRRPDINSHQPIFTDFYVVNEEYYEYYERLRDLREKLVRNNRKGFVMSTMNISHNYYKLLESEKGGEQADIENLGYSRKHLSNVLRMNKTLKSYIQEKPFKECLTAMDQDLIKSIRELELIDLEHARELASFADKETKEIAMDYYYKSDGEHLEVLAELEDILVDLVSHNGRLNK